jgi:thymidylate kinase
VSTEAVAIDVGEASTSPGSTFEGAAVAALVACLDDLVNAHVRHCAWKSNDHLLAALAGETDIDLLVDPRSAGDFAAVISRHGAKRVVPPRAAAYPGMQHYVGLDRESGRLFHLHVHFQLVLGERYVKNYRLPIEDQVLDGTRTLDGVPVPVADLELAILAVRALLKYRARDVAKDLLGIRSPGIPEDTRAEIEWLRAGRDLTSVRSGMAPIRTTVPIDVVSSFLAVVARDPRPGLALLRLRARLRWDLRRLRRRGRMRAGATYAHALWRRRRRLLSGRRDEPRMTLPGGGTTVAFVGADGAGKSTVAADVARWLGWKLDARVHYLGSKQPSRPTEWLYLVFRALRRSQRATSRRLGQGSLAARPIATVRDMALALHYLSVGLDRQRHHARAHREARAGRIVIFDRYPLTRVSDRPEHQALDGRQVAVGLAQPPGWLAVLASVEARLYRRFELPDHVVFLDVDPVVAARRKPDHHPDVIRSKCSAAAELAALAQAAGGHVTRIDANQPLDRVLLDVKARLWDAL